METHLYQDQNPAPKQILWIKSEKRGWIKSKIKAVMEQRSVAEGEEFSLRMTEFPNKVITITKYPEKAMKSKQDIYGWTRCPTIEEQQVLELWEKEFENANEKETHNLNLHKSVIESEIKNTFENNGNDRQNRKHGRDKVEVYESGNKGTKDDRDEGSEKPKGKS